MMAVVIVVVLAGCVTTTQVPPEAKSRTYDVTMQQAFDAVRMFYADNDAQIQAGGIDDGYLNATIQSEQIRPMLTGYQIQYDVQFFDVADGVRIRANISLQDEDRGTQSEWGKEGYDEFFAEVESYLP
jgi:hypothetical protein